MLLFTTMLMFGRVQIANSFLCSLCFVESIVAAFSLSYSTRVKEVKAVKEKELVKVSQAGKVSEVSEVSEGRKGSKGRRGSRGSKRSKGSQRSKEVNAV